MSDEEIQHNPGGIMAEINRQQAEMEAERERYDALPPKEKAKAFREKLDAFCKADFEAKEAMRKAGPTLPGAILLSISDDWFVNEITHGGGGITYMMGTSTLEKIEERAAKLGVVPYWKKE